MTIAIKAPEDPEIIDPSVKTKGINSNNGLHIDEVRDEERCNTDNRRAGESSREAITEISNAQATVVKQTDKLKNMLFNFPEIMKQDFHQHLEKLPKILERMPHVDPDKFSTALLCGSTASRQVVSPSVDSDKDDSDNNSLEEGLQRLPKIFDKMANVDSDRFPASMFCGTTASCQVVSSSADSEKEDSNEKSFDNEVESFIEELPSNSFQEEKNLSKMEVAKKSAELLSKLLPEIKKNRLEAQKAALNRKPEKIKREKLTVKAAEITKEKVEDRLAESGIRRDLATKILAKKVLEGYSLRDALCESCDMPMMEKGRNVECVVCPELFGHRLLTRDNELTQKVEKRWAKEANYDPRITSCRKQKQALEKARLAKIRLAKEKAAASARAEEVVRRAKEKTSNRQAEATLIAEKAAVKTREILKFANEITSRKRGEEVGMRGHVELQAGEMQVEVVKVDGVILLKDAEVREAARKVENTRDNVMSGSKSTDDEASNSVEAQAEQFSNIQEKNVVMLDLLGDEKRVNYPLYGEILEREREVEHIRDHDVKALKIAELQKEVDAPTEVELEGIEEREINGEREVDSSVELKQNSPCNETRNNISLVGKKVDVEEALPDGIVERDIESSFHLKEVADESKSTNLQLQEAEEKEDISDSENLRLTEKVTEAQELLDRICYKQSNEQEEAMQMDDHGQKETEEIRRMEAQQLLEDTRLKLRKEEVEKERVISKAKEELALERSRLQEGVKRAKEGARERTLEEADLKILQVQMKCDEEKIEIEHRIASMTKEVVKAKESADKMLRETTLRLQETERKREELFLEHEHAQKLETRKAESALLAEKLVKEVEVVRRAQAEAEKLFSVAQKELMNKQKEVENSAVEEIRKLEKDSLEEISCLQHEAAEARKTAEEEIERRNETQHLLEKIQTKLAEEEKEKDRQIAESQETLKSKVSLLALQTKAAEEAEIAASIKGTEAQKLLEEARAKLALEEAEKISLLEESYEEEKKIVAEREYEVKFLQEKAVKDSEIIRLQDEAKRKEVLCEEIEVKAEKEQVIRMEISRKLKIEEAEKARLLVETEEMEKELREDIEKKLQLKQTEKERILSEAQQAGEARDLVVALREKEKKQLEEIRQKLKSEKTDKILVLAAAHKAAKEADSSRILQIKKIENETKATVEAYVVDEAQKADDKQRVIELQEKLAEWEAEKERLITEVQVEKKRIIDEIKEMTENTLIGKAEEIECLKKEAIQVTEARDINEKVLKETEKLLKETRATLAEEEEKKIKLLEVAQNSAKELDDARKDEISMLAKDVASAKEARVEEEKHRVTVYGILAQIHQQLQEKETEKCKLLEEAGNKAKKSDEMTMELEKLLADVKTSETARKTEETRRLDESRKLEEIKQRLAEEKSEKVRLLTNAEEAATQANQRMGVEITQLKAEIEAAQNARHQEELKRVKEREALEVIQQKLAVEEKKRMCLLEEAEEESKSINSARAIAIEDAQRAKEDAMKATEEGRRAKEQRIREIKLWEKIQEEEGRNRLLQEEQKKTQREKLEEEMRELKRLMAEEEARKVHDEKREEKQRLREEEQRLLQEKCRAEEERIDEFNRRKHAQEEAERERAKQQEMAKEMHNLLLLLAEDEAKREEKEESRRLKELTTEIEARKQEENARKVDEERIVELNRWKSAQEKAVKKESNNDLSSHALSETTNSHTPANSVFSFERDHQNLVIVPRSGAKHFLRHPVSQSLSLDEIDEQKAVTPKSGLNLLVPTTNPSGNNPLLSGKSTISLLTPRRPPRPEETYYENNTDLPSQTMSESMITDIRDDISVITEAISKADESIASETLDMLVSRMDQCKAQLEEDGIERSTEKQLEVASLLEKLAAAALAVRYLEDSEMN